MMWPSRASNVGAWWTKSIPTAFADSCSLNPNRVSDPSSAATFPAPRLFSADTAASDATRTTVQATHASRCRRGDVIDRLLLSLLRAAETRRRGDDQPR